MKPIVLFIGVPRFLLELKANISQKSEYIEDIEDSVLDADLVVWDDIGSKNGTEFEVSHLLSIIDTRINNSVQSSVKTVNADIAKSTGKTSSAGSTNINVIQPSITCYMFKRVS